MLLLPCFVFMGINVHCMYKKKYRQRVKKDKIKTRRKRDKGFLKKKTKQSFKDKERAYLMLQIKKTLKKLGVFGGDARQAAYILEQLFIKEEKKGVSYSEIEAAVKKVKNIVKRVILSKNDKKNQSLNSNEQSNSSSMTISLNKHKGFCLLVFLVTLIKSVFSQEYAIDVAQFNELFEAGFFLQELPAGLDVCFLHSAGYPYEYFCCGEDLKKRHPHCCEFDECGNMGRCWRANYYDKDSIEENVPAVRDRFTYLYHLRK